jgi:hypothetical protein
MFCCFFSENTYFYLVIFLFFYVFIRNFHSDFKINLQISKLYLPLYCLQRGTGYF